MQTTNLLISSILQIILFSAIPFVWWLMSGRKEQNFFTWLGIKKPAIQNKIAYSRAVFFAVVILLVPSYIAVTLFVDESTLASSQFLNQGVSALLPAFIYSFLQTGFSEELFFRGFLTKRLVHTFGFHWGNIVQGSVFGIMHGIMFISVTGLFAALLITAITGTAGYLLGWINEKQSGGSIISSWIIHGFVNMIVSAVAMFGLL